MVKPTVNDVHGASMMGGVKMPYKSMDDVNSAIRGIDPPVTLDQANMIARMAEGMEDDPDVDNPWAAAIAQFKRMFRVVDGKWAKNNLKKDFVLVGDELLDLDTVCQAWIEKEGREELREARERRAKRYGIGVKEGGNLTPPKGYPTDESDYGDPVNYRYPIDASHILPARQYFNHEGQMEAGGYTSAEWAIIGRRIARASGSGYAYKAGKIVSTTEKSDFEMSVPILKADTERHLVYGVVLVPNVVDKQGDIITEDEIEKTAHRWMIRGLTISPDLIDNQHLTVVSKDKARPVESYIAPVDFTLGDTQVVKGSWVLVTHVPDDSLWSEIKSGRKKAYSIRGVGKRIPV